MTVVFCVKSCPLPQKALMLAHGTLAIPMQDFFYCSEFLQGEIWLTNPVASYRVRVAILPTVRLREARRFNASRLRQAHNRLVISANSVLPLSRSRASPRKFSRKQRFLTKSKGLASFASLRARPKLSQEAHGGPACLTPAHGTRRISATC